MTSTTPIAVAASSDADAGAGDLRHVGVVEVVVLVAGGDEVFGSTARVSQSWLL